MVASQLFIVSVVRALVEVAGLFLLGQGLLWVLAGASRERNGVYRLFQLVTRPVIRLVRALLPRIILDRHIPVLSFFLLFWLWIALAYLRQSICAAQGLICA